MDVVILNAHVSETLAKSMHDRRLPLPIVRASSSKQYEPIQGRTSSVDC